MLDNTLDHQVTVDAPDRAWVSPFRQNGFAMRLPAARQHIADVRDGTADNAVVESFFHLLKRVKVRRRKYRTREAARRDGFDDIELFYNPKRKHTTNATLSPPLTHAMHVLLAMVNFEKRQLKLEKAGF